MTKSDLSQTSLYIRWRRRHSVYNTYRRHIGGMLCCSSV